MLAARSASRSPDRHRDREQIAGKIYPHDALNSLCRRVSFASDTRRGFSDEVREGISRMKINRHDTSSGPTLRELLATASDLAFEYSSGTQDAYKLTRQAFVEILRDAFHKRHSIDRHFPGTKYLH
jgi:hypothetical protein